MNLVRLLIKANRYISNQFDTILPDRLREDGNACFGREFIPQALQPGTVVYDVGGGSRPCLTPNEKERLKLTLVGLDISTEELDAAPLGIYDRKIVHDLCSFAGNCDADAVVCQAVLEHVPDTANAMRALSTMIKPGGRIFIFIPSRNALFARINMAFPENLKRRLLFFLFPQKAEGHDGFKAYYDHCTPSEIERLAKANGLQVEERKLFWMSSYFTVLAPLFVLWRLWQGLAYLTLRQDAAETFIYVFKK